MLSRRALFLSPVLLATLFACSGDDTNPLAPDAGAGVDASVDATVVLDAASADAGLCTPPDAAGLDPAKVAAGRAIVLAMKCQQCHGETMSGNPDGVPSPGYGTAYPPNLTPDPVTGIGCWTDSQIENAFLHGLDDQGGPLCPPMPHFGDIQGGIDAAAAPDVLAFLRSLYPIVSDVPDSPDCTMPPELDAGGDDDSGEPTDAGHDAGHEAGADAGQDSGSTDAGAGDASLDSATDAALPDATNDD